MATTGPPAPNTPGVTYLNVPAIRAELDGIKKGTSEGHVAGVWNAILSWMFPVTDGYVTRPQDIHRYFGGAKGFSDLHTFQYDAAGRRRFFLIVQCKPYSSEGSTADWQEAANQLRDYLSAIHKTRPAGRRTRVYGIAALGRRVRFFEYNDLTRNANGWRPSGTWAVTHNGREFYDMRREATEVQSALDFILNNH
ncbi:uncharacterized protein TRUGW13939_07592 [Talaromyces rugulosus]|uniref:Uncharacterized protein n=1 Tax=Talaromyces rugulosus TaxID=121627 RepID=A0A7H8R2G6_TALRU|nr:uncharacterized protein TRUGW13939_07592 [Talaromyces rugulosus]QKX60447.1 hypothetical protein TRUGW13939_07592 [Talaromyces rugulosus]